MTSEEEEERDRFQRKEEEVFFVDTNSTCFLCLQNSAPVPPPQPSVLIPVDAEENDVIPPNPQGSGRGEALKTAVEEPFCLRKIFKLLQLDPAEVLSKKLPAGPFIGSNMAVPALSVVLCGACRQVCGQLSGFFRELEVLQRKVDHSLQNMAAILAKSEGDPSRLAEFQRTIFDPFEHLCAAITELIRRETLERCTNHLQNSLPKVSLSGPWRKVPLSSPANDPVPAETPTERPAHGNKDAPTAAFICSICHLACKSAGSLMSHLKFRHRIQSSSAVATSMLPQFGKFVCHKCGASYQHKASLCKHALYRCKFREGAAPAVVRLEEDSREIEPPSTMSLEELLSSAPHFRGEDGGDQLGCPLCPSANQQKFPGGDAPLKEHLATDHPHYFFAASKLPNCSPSRFRTLCAQLLQDELPSAYVQCVLDKNRGTFSNCVHCTYHCRDDQWSMVTHLVLRHYSIYAPKLEELQRAEPEEAKQKATSNPSNRYTCQGCKRVYTGFYKYRRHKLRHFCGGSKLVPGDNVRTQPFRCGDCGKTFLCVNSIGRHRKGRCPHRQNANSADGRKPQGRPIRCRNCGKAFRSEKSVRDHNCSHLDIGPAVFASMTAAPSKGVTFPCEKCGFVFSNEGNLELHRKEKGPCNVRETEPEQRVTPKIPRSSRVSHACCKVCGKCMTTGSIWRHQKTTCPYRSRKAPPSDDLLPDRGSPRTVYKCLFDDCDLQFNLVSRLRSHIAESHPSTAFRNWAPAEDSAPTATSDDPSTKLEGRGCHCAACGKKLANKKTLNVHRKRYCPYRNVAANGEESRGAFQCGQCQGEFPLLSDLGQHIASVHQAAKATIPVENAGEEEEGLGEVDEGSYIYNHPNVEVLEPEEGLLLLERKMIDGTAEIGANVVIAKDEEQRGSEEDVRRLLPADENPDLLTIF